MLLVNERSAWLIGGVSELRRAVKTRPAKAVRESSRVLPDTSSNMTALYNPFVEGGTPVVTMALTSLAERVRLHTLMP